MHKSTLWLIFAILCIYFSLVLSGNSRILQELITQESNDLSQHNVTALQEEARRRHGFHGLHGFHHLHSLWGFYGLAIAYLVKVKIVVVAFFLGSAVYLGLRYLWPHKCAGGEYFKEGSIILDHPPSFAHHHDHIPYSFDHDHHHSDHYDGGSFTSSGPSSLDPYSAYSSQTFGDTDHSFPSTGADSSSEILPADAHTFRRRKRSDSATEVKQETGLLENLARQMVVQEEQIGDFMLNFLGLDTIPCRRRFVCEMEFRSQLNPLTAMAFRVIGRNVFAKYTNNQNPFGKAASFEECAAVNAECVFIENNEESQQDPADEVQQPEPEEQNSTNQLVEEPVTAENSDLENNDIIEQANEHNFRAELRTNFFRKRLRGDRYLKFT